MERLAISPVILFTLNLGKGERQLLEMNGRPRETKYIVWDTRYDSKTTINHREDFISPVVDSDGSVHIYNLLRETPGEGGILPPKRMSLIRDPKGRAYIHTTGSPLQRISVGIPPPQSSLPRPLFTPWGLVTVTDSLELRLGDEVLAQLPRSEVSLEQYGEYVVVCQERMLVVSLKTRRQVFLESLNVKDILGNHIHGARG